MLPFGSLPSAFARSHGSGSRRYLPVKITRQRRQRTDRETSIANPRLASIVRSAATSRSNELKNPAAMLPIVDRTCSIPSASARRIGHSLGDQRHRESEHSADAEAGEKAADGEVPVRLTEERQARKHRIDQHGHGQHSGPTVAIAERTENQPADAPADQEYSRYFLARRLHDSAQFRRHAATQRGNARERKQPLIEAIEEPRRAGDEKNEPVVAGQACCPAVGVSDPSLD